MRLYYIVSGTLLILSIIDFAVTAPVLVQEKIQARVDVVHMPGDAMTMLGKRGDDSGELGELWVELFDHPESHFPPKPEELPAMHPLSSLPPSEPADGSMSSNRYRLSIKSRYQCPVKTMYRRTEATS
jgi:hypothetical protein